MPVAPPTSSRQPAAMSASVTPLYPDRQAVHTAEQLLALAFAPLHKRAFGTAVGVAAALLLFGFHALDTLVARQDGVDLALLAQFFAGYRESWLGGLIGAAWAFGVGFVAGWFAAFVRNLVLTTWLFVTRTRAELRATRDFLDHI